MIRYITFLFALLLAPLAFASGIDINAATAAQLDALPGIGPSKAEAIVAYRAEHGPFGSVDELDNVPGIGAATIAGLRDQVTLGGEGAAPAAAVQAAPAAQAAVSAGPATGAVNINTATAAQLQTLPGVGATKAAAIVEDRLNNGPFASCTALTRVMGIGPATVANMGASCTVQ